LSDAEIAVFTAMLNVSYAVLKTIRTRLSGLSSSRGLAPPASHEATSFRVQPGAAVLGDGADMRALTAWSDWYGPANALHAPPVSLRYSGVTVAEAAHLLDLSEEHVRRLLRRGVLLGIPYGGRIGWRLDRDYVDAVAQQLGMARHEQEMARRAERARARRR
jgi:excisionase family DNA binding protein